MLIRCWGARGSVPVSGSDYVRYGGDTACIEVRTKQGSIVIIDAGTGIRRLGNLLLSEKKHAYTMIFTHVHWDHIIGFPFFKPIFERKVKISIMGCPFQIPAFRETLATIMNEPYFPVNIENIKAKVDFTNFCRGKIQIDGMTIAVIPLSHPNGGLGFRFEEDGRSFVYLTDNELGYRHPGGMKYADYAAFSKDADILVHDAEYLPAEYATTRKWGHSTYKDAVRLALDAKAASLGLFHHNQDRKDDDLDMIVEDCQKMVDGKNIRCFAVNQYMEISLAKEDKRISP
ncbi:MAG: MBL fold metallo-hydrolase [Syntrophobacterales bacterium]|nr:MBL fold metallo-hydrolase [Syntrophobacterales bacterium]